jgi:hypothetical protein
VTVTRRYRQQQQQSRRRRQQRHRRGVLILYINAEDANTSNLESISRESSGAVQERGERLLI